MVEKLSITLPADMVAYIKAQVDAGRFASTSEVLREAVRSWTRQEEEYDARLTAIRARIQQSLDDPRPAIDIDEVRERLALFYAQNQKAS